jgi:hypothetical protein
MTPPLLFVTAYDPPTDANLNMAMRFSKHHDHRLLGKAATRQNLLVAIATLHPQAIFMMSHGRLHEIKDNNEISALHSGDGSILNGRTVFAWACWTGAQLGYDLSQAGANWWGYDCKITAPDDRKKYARIQANFFKLCKQLYATAKTKQDVLAILDRLELECKKSLASLDQAGAGHDVDAFSIYSTCNQFWERLLVWQAGTVGHIRHPSAPSVYIDI